MRNQQGPQHAFRAADPDRPQWSFERTAGRRTLIAGATRTREIICSDQRPVMELYLRAACPA
ncbi:hypothetical protein [Arthrobacter sp. B1805]|uniref:hypothetical protein n=1 Tax=Arthrobacter sp. B1805 TaxID=2058892 RepID=UPI000CE397CD|nr:hypothetical protein [Arthrobacter sp. B1805]